MRSEQQRLGYSAAVMAIIVAARCACGATVEKADNTIDLDLPGSWVGGVVPGPGTLAQWDSTVTSANSVNLGADIGLGIVVTNPGGDVSILDDGHTLALGSLDMSGATRRLTINAPVSLASRQVWNIKTMLTINSDIDAASSVNLISKSGAGTLVLAGANSFSATGGNFGLDGGMLDLGSSAALNSFVENLSGASAVDLMGFNARVGALSGSASIMNSGAASASLTTFETLGVSTTISGFLGNPGAAGTLTLVKGGLGDLSFAGSDVRSAGSLTLEAGTAWLNKAGAVDAFTTLVLNGGRLMKTFNGTQSFAQTQVMPGNSSLGFTGGTASHVINLGSIERSVAGGTVDFPFLSASATNGYYTSASLTSSGILGGWAVNLGVDSGWLTRDTTSATSRIVPLAPGAYTFAFGAGANTIVSPATVVTPDASTGSILFNDGSTLALNGVNVVESGGILIGHGSTGGVPGAIAVIAGANSSITSGNGKDLIVSASNGPLTLSSAIVDNGATPIALTKSGTSSLTLGGPNTYSGGTYLNAGQIIVMAGSNLGSGPVWMRGSNSASTLILRDGVMLSNDFIVNDDGNGKSASEINVPTGSATLSGNYTVPGNAPNYYNIFLSGGTLTLTGTHTSGSAASNGQSAGTMLGGVTNSSIIFAGTGSLTSYSTPLEAIGLLTFNLTLRDDARISVINPGANSGLDLGIPAVGNFTYGTITLTMADRAVIDLGTASLDIQHLSSPNYAQGNTVLNLDGGSIRLGSFIKSTGTTLSTLNLNGTTIVATRSSTSFLPDFELSVPTLVGVVREGGARFDTAGFNITVGVPLNHDPALGSAPDGGLTKLGAGTLTLAAPYTQHGPPPLHYTGPTTIAQGALVLINGSTANSVGIITGPGDLSVGNDASAYFLTSDGVTVGAWSIRGRHTIRSGIGEVGTSKVNALSLINVSGGTTLDINDNKLILESDPAVSGDKVATETSLQAALHSGMGNGNWLGSGITSSTVAADQSASGGHMTALALYDNAVLKFPTFGGQQVDDNSLLVTTALAGDANFDNVVDLLDATIVANHWQSVQHSWSAGDLNDDGFVDLLDLTIIANHWQQRYTPPAAADSAFGADDGFTPVTVPEPGSLVLMLPLGGVLLRRMRRRR